MSEKVHFIPVGFDFDRLILPITKGELEADRVVLITHKGESDDEHTTKAAELADHMKDQLQSSFELLDVKVEQRGIEIDSLYEYENLYSKAYSFILEELDDGNEVYVNISSMPRTVAFAFATAADSLITEDRVDNARDHVHTLYVGPNNYLVTDMIETLEKTEEQLRGYEDLDLIGIRAEIDDLIERVYSSGVTEGTEFEDPMYVEFPSSPSSDLDDFESQILRFLENHGPVRSTSVLAEQLASDIGQEYNDSFRSRVQYNVGKLEGKGYIDRERAGNRMETQLSTMGRMWTKTR